MTKRLWFMPEPWQKMWALTAACDVEISAMGIVAENDPSLVEDLFVVKQLCTGIRTEIDADALQELTMQLRSIGVAPSRMRVWWHSHVNMKTDFSGTDDDNIRRYAADYLWSVCTNKSDATRVNNGLLPLELNIRCDIFDQNNPKDPHSPLRHTYEKCTWGLLTDNEFKDWAETVVAEKVVRPAPPAAKSYSHSGGYQYPGPNAGRFVGSYQDPLIAQQSAYTYQPPRQPPPSTAIRTVPTAPPFVPAGWTSPAKDPTAAGRDKELTFANSFVDSAYHSGMLNRGEALELTSILSPVEGISNPGILTKVEDYLAHVAKSLRRQSDTSMLNDLFAAYKIAVGLKAELGDSGPLAVDEINVRVTDALAAGKISMYRMVGILDGSDSEFGYAGLGTTL